MYDSTPDFCDEKALEDVNRQLAEVGAVFIRVHACFYRFYDCMCFVSEGYVVESHFCVTCVSVVVQCYRQMRYST